MKSMIMQSINEMKQGFNQIDKNINLQINKVSQQINTSNVSLFNNFKGVQNNYKQDIVDLCVSNNKTIMKSHESVLKSHLQQIASKLSELNQAQTTTINMALQQRPNMMNTNIKQPSFALSDAKQQAASNQGGGSGNFQQAINQSNVRLYQQLQTHIDKKVNEVKIWVEARRNPPPSDGGDSSNGSSGDSNNGNGASSRSTQEILAIVTDLKEFLHGDIVKEIQRITNLREIHGKVDQLPHKMAFKKDVLQIEQNVHKMLTQTQASLLNINQSPIKQQQRVTPTAPISSTISPTKPAQNNQMMNVLNQSMTSGFHNLSGFGQQMDRSPSPRTQNNNLMTDIIDQFMGVMMMKFDHWLQEIEAGIQSNTFNIYTIIYILSTIVFTRFYQHWTSDPSQRDERERKSMEMEMEEEEEQKGGYDQRDQAILIKKIQKMKVDAMNLLNRIEMELENDELDEISTINAFGAFITENKTKPGIDSLWIPQQSERIEYKFKGEMRMIKQIKNIENKINKMINKQKTICGKDCIFNICGIGIIISVGLFALIINKLLSEENSFH